MTVSAQTSASGPGSAAAAGRDASEHVVGVRDRHLHRPRNEVDAELDGGATETFQCR